MSLSLAAVTREFNDPRAQQLTGFDLPNGFGLPGNDDKPQSVIVDPNFSMPAFTEPTFNTMVIYELHIGTFNNTFAGAVQKLDYLKNLGINAVEVLPITQNPLFSDHTPPDHDWGYDPVQLFAVKSKYGTPQEFKEFVKQCHQRQIAVIVDVVYNHLVENNLLQAFGGFTTSGDSRRNLICMAVIAPTPASVRARTTAGRKCGSTSTTTRCCCSATTASMDCGSTTRLTFARSVQRRRIANNEGAELLREINSSYRNTDPKQPGKITIAEDLQSSGDVTLQTGPIGLEFNSQWDDTMVNVMRDVVTKVNDSDRDLGAVKGALEKKMASDVFTRVVYTENHDQVGHPPGQNRLPTLIDINDHESIFAKKRSTLAAAIMLTVTRNSDDFSGSGDAGDARLRLQHADQQSISAGPRTRSSKGSFKCIAI